MKISVIIPAKEGVSVDKPINSIAKSNYKIEDIEIFVCRGTQPSMQRNLASKSASGDLIYFLDNDSEIDKSSFDNAVKLFSDNKRFPNLAIVGGPNLTPSTDTIMQKAFGCALASKFAHSKMSSRYRKIGNIRKSNEKELILCNMVVKREIFVKEGGFNETLYPNEENEFMNRLISKGYELVYHPDVVVYRSRRENTKKFIKQIFTYGRGRMEQILIEGLKFNLFAFIPIVFTLYFIAFVIYFLLPPINYNTPIGIISNIIFLLPMFIYLFIAFVSSFQFARTEKQPLLFLILPPIYIIMHISYACGMIWGFIKNKITHSKDKNKPNDVKLRLEKVKEFGTSMAIQHNAEL